MIAPANVPQVITVESFHQRLPSPRVGMSTYEAAYVARTETIEVSHTRVVSGASKFILSTPSYLLLAMASLAKYERPLAITMTMRIMKIQTSS